MLEQEIDVAKLVSNAPLGMSTINWSVYSDQPNPPDEAYEPMFFFKMADGEVEQIGDRPIVEARVIGFPAGSVFIVVIMFRFPGIDHIHEVFINHFTDDPMGSMLKGLAKLDELTLLLFEPKSRLLDYTPVRVINLKNEVNWNKFLAQISEYYLEPWPVVDFTLCKNQCPPVQTLWELAEKCG